MTHRHGVYLAAGIAAAGLLVELAWAILDRHPLHLPDRIVRSLNRKG